MIGRAALRFSPFLRLRGCVSGPGDSAFLHPSNSWVASGKSSLLHFLVGTCLANSIQRDANRFAVRVRRQRLY